MFYIVPSAFYAGHAFLSIVNEKGKEYNRK